MTARHAAVVADRFPAVVQVGGETHTQARVVLTRPEGDQPGELIVWLDSRPTPREVWRSRWDPSGSALPHGRSPWTVATEGGPVLVSRDRGCGCSSPMKTWRPWPDYRLAQMPAEVTR